VSTLGNARLTGRCRSRIADRGESEVSTKRASMGPTPPPDTRIYFPRKRKKVCGGNDDCRSFSFLTIAPLIHLRIYTYTGSSRR